MQRTFFRRALTINRMKKILLHTIFCVFLGLAPAGAAWGAQKLSPAEQRFYRAVYVLQSLGGPAAGEKITIPGTVRLSDATESLVNHPDKTFALRQATEELNALSLAMPEALLYAAYGNLILNEQQKAVDQLRRYTDQAGYRAAPYELLCGALYSMRDYAALEKVLEEWEKKEPQCLEAKLLFTFSLLYHQGKYAEAGQYLARMQPCGSWKAQVFAAMATRAMGHSRQAESEIENIRKAYPREDRNIELFWERLKARESFF